MGGWLGLPRWGVQVGRVRLRGGKALGEGVEASAGSMDELRGQCPRLGHSRRPKRLWLG